MSCMAACAWWEIMHSCMGTVVSSGIVSTWLHARCVHHAVRKIVSLTLRYLDRQDLQATLGVGG